MKQERIAIICVGNVLMGDDAVGIEVYNRLKEGYVFPDNVELFDCGCMSLNQINLVRDFDLIISIDALDNTGYPPGSVLRCKPEDMKASSPLKHSLHNLRLADLFESALLLGYEAEGICLGMQVESIPVNDCKVGLSSSVKANINALLQACISELSQLGITPLNR